MINGTNIKMAASFAHNWNLYQKDRSLNDSIEICRTMFRKEHTCNIGGSNCAVDALRMLFASSLRRMINPTKSDL